MTAPKVWNEPFHVRAYETDPHGYLTIQSLCDYLQEAASNHAEALDVSVARLSPLGLAWVLARLRVQVDDYPQWRERVQVTTWPSGEDRLFATREFLVQAEDGTTLARATSAWLLMHVERKRPARLPDFVRALDLPDRPLPLEEGLATLEPPSHPGHEQRFRVRYSDLDVNAHVNNARYVEWLSETVPEQILRNYCVTDLQLHFQAETYFGETVLGRTQQTVQGDVLEFTHDLVTLDDERQVAIARTSWLPL